MDGWMDGTQPNHILGANNNNKNPTTNVPETTAGRVGVDVNMLRPQNGNGHQRRYLTRGD